MSLIRERFKQYGDIAVTEIETVAESLVSAAVAETKAAMQTVIDDLGKIIAAYQALHGPLPQTKPDLTTEAKGATDATGNGPQ
jgi:tRNA G37 N-methylase Trm5